MFGSVLTLFCPPYISDCTPARSRTLGVILTAFFFALATKGWAQTPSGNVVISTNTSWAEGNYQVSSLTVNSGATLTVGGGSTITVSGAVVVTANSNITLQAINNTAQVNGTWQGTGVKITAASIEVDSGSTINADGQGYVPNAGPGGSPVGSYDGGSYGGLGAVQQYPIAAASPIYGSSIAPVDLGSGGDLEGGSTGASGGGAIYLSVSGTLTNNGVISANGASPSTTGGSGSGGSVYVQTSALAGSGTFLANGGTGLQNGAYGGGGGRIAVYYNGGSSSFTGFATSTASGGQGSYTPGNNGTSGFFDTSTTDQGLSVYQNFVLPAGTTTTYNAVTVQTGATFTVGGGSTITVDNALKVSGTLVAQAVNNTALVNGSWQGAGITVNAASVQVDTGASINADSQGYVPTAGPGGTPLGTDAGASYGGLGGTESSYTPLPVYGSATTPSDLGSGGSSTDGTENGTAGGAGGGALRLTVSGTLTNNGTISTNGGSPGGSNGHASGGSGGSLFIQVATLAGSGSIQANGGQAYYAGGGGGGRIALYYTTNSGFNLASVIANGGPSGGVAGGAGTVYTLGANTNLTVSDNVVLPANSNLNYASIVVNNSGVLTLGSGTTLTTASVMVSNGSTVNIGGGSNVTVSGALLVTGNSNVVAQGLNTAALVNGSWQGTGATINAASIEVDAGSSINADMQGYAPAAGPGGAQFGTDPGASYGGLGGAVNSYISPPTYGSSIGPIALGSGGSSTNGTVNGLDGGSGGGALRLIVTGTLTDNGTISANGQSQGGANGNASGGSGGSLFLQVATLAGSGVIQANGGQAYYAGGGGGGRVAVYYVMNSGFTPTQATASGAAGGGTGGNGSVVLTGAPTYSWLLPTEDVLHGTETLEWFAGAVDLLHTTVDLVASGPDTLTLATNLNANSSFSLDCTTLKDGRYELRLIFHDASGNDIQEVPRTFVVNNSVAWHSGVLPSSQEWNASQVQALDGAVIVPSGVTLTVDPGTIVKALPGAQIIVQAGGILNALGTSALPIIFTTFDDSSVGGDTDFTGGLTLPYAGEWNGIVVQAGGQFNENANTELLYVELSLSGSISSQTLLSDQTYDVNGTLSVPSGSTLTIQPGTVVKFAAGAGMSVQSGATLIANGTLAQPIFFTSINDSSVGGNTSGSSQAPAPGDWATIALNGANATFNYVHFLYGGGPVTSNNLIGMIQTGGSSTITISNSVLADSFFNGILTGTPGGGDTVSLINSVVTGVEDRGIDAFPGSTVNVVNDTFDANSSGMEVHGGTVTVANTIVSNSTSTQFGGIDFYQGTLNISYSDVWTSAPGVANYSGITDPTGTNGNISANPLYVNAPLGDYRLNFGSPAIDAANGPAAPLTDSMGDPRYNDPRVTTKTGVPNSAGNYPDLGAFEYVETAPSDIDLTIPSVTGPATAIVGTQVQLTWTDANVGSGTAQGPWHDAIYLVQDPDTNPVAIYAGDVLVAGGVTLGPGASVISTGTIRVPGTTVGNHRWEVKANDRGQVFVGQNSANATGISLDAVAIDLPELVLDTPATSNSFTATGQSIWFKLTPGANKAVNVSLTLAGTSGAVQLFVGQGYVPTPQHYDFQQVQFNSTTASLVIPSTSSPTYYVTVYAQLLPVSPTPFTIAASTVQFSLASVSPNAIVNSGSQTLTFVGGGFTSAGTYQIVDGTGAKHNAVSIFLSDAAHAAATFAMSGLPTGSYGAQVTESGTTVSLSNAVAVGGIGPGSSNSTGGQVQVSISTPQDYRAGFPFQADLIYQNLSSSDLPAPMILVLATNAVMAELPPPCTGCTTNFPFMYQNETTSTSLLFLGISNQGPAGVLPAGASGSIPLLVTGANGDISLTTQVLGTATADPLIGYNIEAKSCSNDPIDFPGGCVVFTVKNADDSVRAHASPNDTSGYIDISIGNFLDASSFCSAFQPPFTSAAGFSRVCMQLLVGSDYQANPTSSVFIGPYLNLDGRDLNSLLAADATALSGQGIYESDGNRLIQFELQNDGLSLFNRRYHQGAFGFGSSHAFDITGQLYNGFPVVHYPDGSSRLFPTVSPNQANLYLATSGDHGILTVNTDGSWTLAESNGLIYDLIPDTQSTVTGRLVLNYIQDLNANRIALTYTNDLVTSVADGFGHSIIFSYDSLGHILQATDAVGRITTYTYDIKSDTLHSTFLTSIADSSGTTTFTWNEGGPSGIGYFADSCVSTYCEPAIGVNTIAYPDGTHTYFTYDALGRVASQYNDGETHILNYSYGAGGTMALTDADGNTTQLTTDEYGDVLQRIDPLGAATQLSYDPEKKLVGVQAPQGSSSSIGYDSEGNLSSLIDSLGNQQSYASIANNKLGSFTDAAGNTTTSSYDASFNPTGTTYPDGSATATTYDSHGNIATVTNRRGHTTTYIHNSANLLTSMTYANGSTASYTYDAHRNLLTSIASNGTTSFTYDSADRLTSIAYPSGQTIQYSYNSGGQRTSMSDSTGFGVLYTYDLAGRISQLASKGGTTIVSYTYDAAGNLTRKSLGNGTYTTYAYDADGNPLHLINYGAGGSLLSEFDYTYDALGRTLTANTPAGTSSYGYDADGELTSAATPTGVIPYSYDVDGNWSTAAGIDYSPNNLNEYTAAGATAYSYDADGNLISGGGYVYTYDDENRMASMTSATDTWAYQYDGLGNRISATHNGTVTQYVNDLSGLGIVEAELNGSGQLISHYTYGRDLTSSVPASGSAAYYAFDGAGNTAQMTNASGSVVNSYSYLPFGQKLTSATGVTNPFTYVGEYGVMDEGSGLYFMRNRWYSPLLGRFVQADPSKLASGDANFYRYVRNEPVNGIDPLGLQGDLEATDPFSSDFSSDTSDRDRLNAAINQAGTAALNGAKPDYLHINVSVGGGGSVYVNLKNGKVYKSLDVTTGTGVGASLGFIENGGEELSAEDVDDFLSGDSVSVGGSAIVSYSRVDSSGKYANEFGLTPSASVGGSYSYGGQDLDDNTRDAIMFYLHQTNHSNLYNSQTKTSQTVKRAKSLDPNGKLTTGYGDQGFVPPNAPILYTIYFENQPTATAPAERVTVTDPLAANLDWSTVQLSQIQFNNVTINVPAGLQTYTGQVNVSTDPNPVSVNATLNPSTGVLSWTMESINPATGGLPADPLAGFLPPNNASNQGTGYVTFTVQPKSGLANATAITNQAAIVFDANASISTNTVTNTLDSVFPTSSVGALGATTSTLTFPVTWSGTDPGGAGIATYNIYVSINGGAYSLWLPTSALSGTYTGIAGATYSFYSIAVDNVGNTQQAPGAAQTTMIVPSAGSSTIAVVSGSGQTAAYGSAFAKPLTVLVKDGNGNPLAGTAVSFSGTGLSFSSGTANTAANGEASTIATAIATGSLTATASASGVSGSPTFSLTATQAPLTVTATNVSVAFGQPIPALTYSVTGFVNGDTSSALTGAPSETTTATNGSPVGTYPVTIAQGTLASGNYSFSTFVNGTLTITSLAAVATPAFSSAAGTYTSSQSIAITDATSGATIYYTTNGTAPTASSTKYIGPITVASSETLEALAIDSGYNNSAVATAVYVISPPAATPVISPAGGTYTAAQTVTITDATSGATIYYTTNGTAPTVNSTAYSGPITVGASETVSAIALATGDSLSAVATAAYVITPPTATPTISPAGGTYTAAQTVTITDTATGAIIYYTTNGAAPTATSSVYSGPITVSASETISAIALAPGDSLSAVATAAYVINIPPPAAAAAPAFSPAAGTYTSVQSVTISDATAAAVIYYTLDGSSPTASSTKYTSAINVGVSETITAIAIANGYTNSALAAAAYTINLPAASFTLAVSPASLSIADGQSGGATLTVTPANGFTSPVTFACSGLPAGAACSFSPATVTPAGTPVTSALTISTTASAALHLPGVWTKAAGGICVAFILWPFRRRRRLAATILAIILLISGGALSGCGSASPSTPKTYSVTVTAKGGGVSQSAPIGLTVTQ